MKSQRPKLKLGPPILPGSLRQEAVDNLRNEPNLHLYPLPPGGIKYNNNKHKVLRISISEMEKTTVKFI